MECRCSQHLPAGPFFNQISGYMLALNFQRKTGPALMQSGDDDDDLHGDGNEERR
jgi:hypothetical protein